MTFHRGLYTTVNHDCVIVCRRLIFRFKMHCADITSVLPSNLTSSFLRDSTCIMSGQCSPGNNQMLSCIPGSTKRLCVRVRLFSLCAKSSNVIIIELSLFSGTLCDAVWSLILNMNEQIPLCCPHTLICYKSTEEKLLNIKKIHLR